MKKIVLIPSDDLVSVDGLSYTILYNLNSNVHSVNFDYESNKGQIEFNNGTPNKNITDFKDFEDLIKLWDIEQVKNNPPSQFHDYEQSLNEWVLNQDRKDDYNSKEWLRNRVEAYSKLNQDELRFDDIKNNTNLWFEKIEEIKSMYPKPELGIQNGI